MPARKFYLKAAISVAALSAIASPLSADEPSYDPAQYLLANVKEGTAREAYLANLIASFEAVDKDADGITAQDIAQLEADELAKLERQFERRISGYRHEMKTLDKNGDGLVAPDEMRAAFSPSPPPYEAERARFERFDVNADGEMSREELRAAGARFSDDRFQAMDADESGGLTYDEMVATARERYEKRRLKAEAQAAQVMAQDDIDEDGFVSFEELTAKVPKPKINSREKAKRDRLFARLMALDTDGDGRVTKEELSKRFAAQFERVDTDNNGSISKEEAKIHEQTLDLALELAKTNVCKVPAVPSGALPLAVFAMEGKKVSSIALDTRAKTTSLIDVEIEAGKEPLFVLLSSDEPAIWAFSGATQRVVGVVLFSGESDDQGRPLIGTTGISEEAVTFGMPGCLPSRKIRSLGPKNFTQLFPLFVASTGIEANIQKHNARVASVSLPSFANPKAAGRAAAPDGFEPALWTEALWRFPQGIGSVDVGSLVTPTSHEPYDIFPVELGLAQLAARGIIEETQHHHEYRIIKPLEAFPASFRTLTFTSFVLGEGIAMPDTWHGAGCIYASDGSSVLKGQHCTQHVKRNAVTIREDDDGEACLIRGDGSNAGCFPEDGRGLQAVEAEGDAVTFEAIPDAEDPIEEMAVPAMPVMYDPPIDLIPAGLRQRW